MPAGRRRRSCSPPTLHLFLLILLPDTPSASPGASASCELLPASDVGAKKKERRLLITRHFVCHRSFSATATTSAPWVRRRSTPPTHPHTHTHAHTHTHSTCHTYHTYVYTCIHTYVCMYHTYVYTYTQRERGNLQDALPAMSKRTHSRCAYICIYLSAQVTYRMRCLP